MRSLLIATALLIGAIAHAQLDGPADPAHLPAWMQQVAFGTKPVPYTLPKRAPLHTNGFTGTWTVQKKHGRRFDFWSDKHRVVIKEVDERRSLERFLFLDLAANVRMNAHVDNDQALFIVEDLFLKDVGYFREIWSDTVQATGRTETINGIACQELLGIDGNKDTTYYWRTDQHPKLFADMKVWSPWLSREGELEFLSALSDTPAGGCMRAEWPARKYNPPAGSISILSVAPGVSPMPTITATQRQVAERRFLWNNNSGIGTLPAWMRAYVSDLEPEPLPAAHTPAPVKRDIPDNKFIGTLTAETPTMILGLHDQKTGRDTTHRLAKYTYWADARRAVLIMDDPDDEGYLFYAVDLDADVVMASHHEMSGHVIPKLYITTLEQVGLKEFGRGLELDFTPRGQTRKMLGRTCELHTTHERFLSHFWFPKQDVLNPVFDMRHWMVQRMGQKMKDLMYFGVADKPMPMAVMGTHLTSYKQGKAKPPVVDLRYFRVRDERLEQRRRREEPPPVEVREITVEEMLSGGYGVAEPGIPMPADDPKPVMVEVEASPDVDMLPPPPPVRVGDGGRQPTAGSGTGRGPTVDLPPFLEETMALRSNRFIGTAVMEYTKTDASGRKEQWQVRYASDSTRILVLGRSKTPDYNAHDRAYLIDRQAGTEQWFGLKRDSTITAHHATIMDRQHRFAFAPAHPDSVVGGSNRILGRACEKRLHQVPTTRRISWVDPSLPSLFQDVLSARKKWGGIEILLLGGMLTSTGPGMPLEADYTYHGGDHVVMKVIDLKPGPVDPKVFEISKDSWTR